ncbi:hypothetical protein HID58_009482 [Brassica napus]|uniref:Uncharacterized protein n=2 Tax=Brassica TaxID=3705 RepID=A0ABQ8DV48_BRANA|nr:hypothetical protein HID58_009482 [Brassica napus]
MGIASESPVLFLVIRFVYSPCSRSITYSGRNFEEEHRRQRFLLIALMNEIFYSPAGRRGLDVAGLPSRKQSMNPCEQLQSPLVRKPFSPLPTTVVASKANIATPQQLLPTPKSNVVNEISAFATPVKNNNSVRNLEEEKMQMMMMQTPKNVGAMILIPSTPATISVPMQTAATPLNNTNARLLQEKAEVVEYSFEERRLAFMLQSESLIHV